MCVSVSVSVSPASLFLTPSKFLPSSLIPLIPAFWPVPRSRSLFLSPSTILLPYSHLSLLPPFLPPSPHPSSFSYLPSLSPCRSICILARAPQFSSCPWPTAAATTLSQTACYPGTRTAPGTARDGPASATTSTAGELASWLCGSIFIPTAPALSLRLELSRHSVSRRCTFNH